MTKITVETRPPHPNGTKPAKPREEVTHIVRHTAAHKPGITTGRK